MMQPKSPRQRFQHGFTLVEALVALVVLSIGMLGIAALYVESLRASRTALLRSHAVTLASDMADRIRANRQANAAYAKAATDHPAENVACAGGAGCTPAALAVHDMAVWDTEVATALPGGTSSIAAAAVAGSGTLFTYTIRVSWVEVGQDGLVTYEMSIRA